MYGASMLRIEMEPWDQDPEVGRIKRMDVGDFNILLVSTCIT